MGDMMLRRLLLYPLQALALSFLVVGWLLEEWVEHALDGNPTQAPD